jgi:hypothetical protein
MHVCCSNDEWTPCEQQRTVLNYVLQSIDAPLDDDECARLKDLPRRRVVDSGCAEFVRYGLVDIIFAYAYDQLVTMGEGNVSGQTVCGTRTVCLV